MRPIRALGRGWNRESCNDLQNWTRLVVVRHNHRRAWSTFGLAARVRLRHLRRAAHLGHMLATFVFQGCHRSCTRAAARQSSRSPATRQRWRRNVNPAWPHLRLLIALHSPTASSKPDCSSALRRKDGTLTPLSPEQSVLSSPVCLGLSRNAGMFCVFRVGGGGISLQSRLRCGAERIRPLGTGLEPVKPDVCVSYSESGASRILCDCLLAAKSSLTGVVPKELEGESLAILWLKLVTSKL